MSAVNSLPTPDEMALQRFSCKDWVLDKASGIIYRRVTGTLVGGYRIIGTTFEEKKRNIMYHRAVWIGANMTLPSAGLQIDHIDGNPINNAIENLRLVTDAENKNNLATKWKRYGAGNPNAKLTADDVDTIKKRLKEAKSLPPSRRRYAVGRIAGEYHVSQTQIRRIDQGLNWSNLPDKKIEEAKA